MRGAFAAVLLAATGSLAQILPVEPEPGEAVLKDFRFASGETLPALKVHYVTVGRRLDDGRGRTANAVLVLHGTGGSSAQFLGPAFAGVLFGPGQPLDASRFYLVIPDGIGHGGSSKPSDGLKARFPRYTYDDMVRAQYRLLTESLGVNHVRLVIGTSMGGMHTWLWGETHPDFMDALLPLARGALSLLLSVSGSPLQWMQQAPDAPAADAAVDRWLADRLAKTDANDLLWALDASRDYDPSPALEKITVPLLAINFGDDAINPPELGILEKGVARVKLGQAVVFPVSEKTRGHQTHTLADLWKTYLVELLLRSRP
jgi:homoserine O-acetyltransferase